MTDTNRRPMTPQELTRIQFVSDPQIAPDGSRVAFVVTTMSEEKDEYQSNVWLVDVEGGASRRFTTGPKRDTSPRWSPDGTRLAFVSEREPKQKPQLYVMPAGGGEPVRLTDLKNGVGNPAWSPDGTQIAFTAKVGGWQEPESEEEKQKSKPPRTISSLKHKLNGEGFTYDRRQQVFVVGAEGGEPRQLTDGDFDHGPPSWSPDGKLLAFEAAGHANRDFDNASDVWIVSVDGGEPRRVTDTAGPTSAPRFSPDGRLIAYAGNRHLNQAGRDERVFVLRTDDGSAACATDGLDASCHDPRWLDQGRTIGFLVEEEGSVLLYRATPDNRPPERIVDGEWQIASFSTSADGRRIAFAASGPVAPAEVFVCDSDGKEERQLTDLNRAWKAEVALQQPERFTYERDEFELDAWIIKPVGFAPGQLYPTLLSIHGGPHAQYGNVFFDEFQVYAGAGYVVVYTNPRGSRGYGEEFSRAVVGDWGGGDYRDVMAALDEAIRRFDFVDPDRLGVLGGSYGGFMTSWVVGHTDRFKAACSERAVNNLGSFFGTSDIGPWFGEAESGALPWDNPSWYVEHSPLTYASNVTTPLLILHAEQDLRCPIEQAEQFFSALKRQGKEVVFVRFPDESHELSRSGKPRHRLERFRIILDWFNQHLKEAVEASA